LNVKAVCQLGCVAHTGKCSRAEVGPIYQPNGNPFKTLAALHFAHSTAPDVATAAGIALAIRRDVAVVLLPGTNATTTILIIRVHLPYHSDAQTCRVCVPAVAEMGDELTLEWDSPVKRLYGLPTVVECSVLDKINYVHTQSPCEAKRSWRYTRLANHAECSSGTLWPQTNLPEFDKVVPLFQPELPCCRVLLTGVQCGWCNREYLTAEEYMQECAPRFVQWFE
jgi:hypothetical protein